MQVHQSRLVDTVTYYDPLLQRYARRLVHDEEAGAAIVMEVLEKQYELNLLAPGKHLRLVLKNDVLLLYTEEDVRQELRTFWHYHLLLRERMPKIQVNF